MTDTIQDHSIAEFEANLSMELSEIHTIFLGANSASVTTVSNCVAYDCPENISR